MKRTVALLCLVSISCISLWARIAPQPIAPGVLRTGQIVDPELTESSGLVASRTFPGVFWTHNDHGSTPKLFAMSRYGGALGKFKVTGATISDWEDISIDSSGNLYLADTGNNDLSRNEVQVYRVIEPNPRGVGSVNVVQAWHLKFPNGPKNFECLFVYGGFGYLVSKERNDNDAVEVFRFPLGNVTSLTLQLVGKVRVPGNVTGGAISRDGQLAALLTENGPFLFRIAGNPLNIVHLRAYFTRYEHSSMEGASFAGDGLLVTSEDGQIFLFNAPPFRTQ
jgi:hypothetical protein